MRDWLSCPLSPATSVHTKSDEGATTDDEYAFINPESSSELDLTEEEGEETSSWLSVLSIFGVSKKLSRKKSGSSSSSSSLNTTMPIEGASNEKESKSEYPEKKSMEANEEHEDEGVHLYQMPMDESCSNSIVSTIESDHHIFTPVSSSLPVDSLSKIPPKCLETHLVKVTKICWNHGGKKVQIMGEFDDWSKPIDLVPDKEQGNIHHVHLPLILNKDMEFKFMVDGEWRYADDLPYREDKNGNINNVIYMESTGVR